VTITISSDDPRSGAGQWLKCTTADGRKAFGVPSQCRSKPGLVYLVDGQSCTCEDFKRNGLSPERRGVEGEHLVCKHILAVRLHIELETAMRMRSQPRRRRGHLELLPSPVAQLAERYDDIFKKFEGE
jgi:hypothetical protein